MTQSEAQTITNEMPMETDGEEVREPVDGVKMTKEQENMVAEFQNLMKNRDVLMNSYIVEKCKVDGLVRNIQQLDSRLEEIQGIINGQ